MWRRSQDTTDRTIAARTSTLFVIISLMNLSGCENDTRSDVSRIGEPEQQHEELIRDTESARPLEDTNWLLLGNSHEMQHHSELAQVNSDTISRLGLAWYADIPSRDGLVGNPLINNGVVFQSGPGGTVFANDLETGRTIWTYRASINYDILSIAGKWATRTNRGLALTKRLVIVASGDCRLIALDQKSGDPVWETESCDSTDFYGITAAPRIGGGMVFTGNACMESGYTRGFVDAFDANTGEHQWRFYTVPSDPDKPQDNSIYEMAVKTWGTGWYEHYKGCGSVWDAMTYDDELGMLFIGVGGITPFSPALRVKDAGDELFTTSIVALDARTGEYIWHFKQVPQDAWNYESSVGIMVADIRVDGEDRRTVISVPKNGFIYLLDAKTGEYLSGKNYVPVTWTTGLDENGRPIVPADAKYWERDGATIVLPSLSGSHGWEALAFNPLANILYIPTTTLPTKIESDPEAVVGGTRMDFYYGLSGDPDWPAFGEIVAWNITTNAVEWRVKHEAILNGGLLHTAGNLVFQGDANGEFTAFDARTGSKLWSFDTGGAIRGAPSTVMSDGTQYIIVPVGNGSAATTGNLMARAASSWNARTAPRLLAFALDKNLVLPAAEPPSPLNLPPVKRFPTDLAESGEKLLEQNACVDCHGLGGESAGGSIPDLRRLAYPFETFDSIVRQGSLSSNGMPKFDYLSDDQSKALYAYLINEAWTAYEASTGSSSGSRDKNNLH